MDIHDTRRNNLRAIIDLRFGGRIIDLATAIDRQQSYVSSLLNGKPPHLKNLGEKLARKIELLLDLEPLSLDSDEFKIQDNGLTPAENLFLTSVRNAVNERAVPGHVMQTIMYLLECASAKDVSQ